MQNLISIIIPVYNSEKYLVDCLISLKNQTYKNLEFLIVYTDSSDNSITILEEFAKNDSRFKIIKNDKHLKGAGNARNIALDYVKGDFLGFVDSDDIVAVDMFESLLYNLKRTNSDIAISKETRNKNDLKLKKYDIREMNRQEALEQLLFGKLYYGELWNKLYRWEKVKKLRFEDVIVAEDLIYVWYAINFSNKIVYINKYNYFYRFNPNGVTKSYSLVEYENQQKILDLINQTLSNQEIKLKRLFNNRRLIMDSQIYYQINTYTSKIDLNHKIIINNELNKRRKELSFRLLPLKYAKKEILPTILYLISPSLMMFIKSIYLKLRKSR